ncbi:hypothetical protein KY289_013481 [Solanum tuberosum]|nr:hypothetical protein KY289_013481 [Solanum tuberosum]
MEQEMKENEEEEKQLKENMMALEDDKEEMPGLQGSYNREGRKKTQVRSKGTNEIEVSNNSKGDNTTLLEDRGSGHKEGTNKDNKEDATANNIKEQGMVETNSEKFYTTDIIEEDEETVKHKQYTEGDEDMEYNIQQVQTRSSKERATHSDQ